MWKIKKKRKTNFPFARTFVACVVYINFFSCPRSCVFQVETINFTSKNFMIFYGVFRMYVCMYGCIICAIASVIVCMCALVCIHRLCVFVCVCMAQWTSSIKKNRKNQQNSFEENGKNPVSMAIVRILCRRSIVWRGAFGIQPKSVWFEKTKSVVSWKGFGPTELVIRWTI
jgi:hypothetical protein